MPILIGTIDSVTAFDGIDRRVLGEHAKVSPHAVISLRGWAIERSQSASAGSIELLVDGDVAGRVRYGLARPDIVRHFDDLALLESGFAATVPAFAIGAGPHVLTIRITDAAATSSVELPPRHIHVVEDDAALARRRLPEGRLDISVDKLDDELELDGIDAPRALWRFRVGVVTGIARDLELGGACSEVHVVLDDDMLYPAIVGYASGGDRTRFKALIPTDDLEAGEHTLRIVGSGGDGLGFASSAEFRFTLLPFGTRKGGAMTAHHSARCHVETFAFGEQGQGRPARVKLGEPVFFRGWALDPLGKQVDLAYLLIDRTNVIDVVLGQERTDLADTMGPGARFAGFVAGCATATLTSGMHRVRLVTFSNGLKEVGESDESVAFEVI